MTVSLPIYMDDHATTRVDDRVLEAMLPYFGQAYGNAASRNHAFGWEAEKAVEQAREQIAASIGAKPREIVLTSGATEADNMAVLGVARMYTEKGRHIIGTSIEHKAVLDPLAALAREGFEVTLLPVDCRGLVSPDDLRSAIRPDTTLVSVMTANNEVGTIQPIAELGSICRERGVLFHTDAAQAVGRLPIDVEEMKIDLLSLSGHKLYGPKGVGALYVRRRNPRVRLAPILFGGGHERGFRSGTLNVPGVVGMARAIELCLEERDAESKRVAGLRDRLQERLLAGLDYAVVNGCTENRLPGNLNISFAYVEGESLLMGMEGIAVSSGSACTSASLEPSHVLRAMAVGEELAHSSIRFGLGRFTTLEQIDYVAEQTVAAVKHLRELSPLYEMVKEGIDLSTVEWSGH